MSVCTGGHLPGLQQRVHAGRDALHERERGAVRERRGRLHGVDDGADLQLRRAVLERELQLVPGLLHRRLAVHGDRRGAVQLERAVGAARSGWRRACALGQRLPERQLRRVQRDLHRRASTQCAGKNAQTLRGRRERVHLVAGDADRAASFCSGGACGTCGPSCTAGATRCNGNGVETCAADANGCTTWGPAAAVRGEPLLRGRRCKACGTTCTPGAKRCAANGMIEQCGTDAATGCTTWGPVAQCYLAGRRALRHRGVHSAVPGPVHRGRADVRERAAAGVPAAGDRVHAVAGPGRLRGGPALRGRGVPGEVRGRRGGDVPGDPGVHRRAGDGPGVPAAGWERIGRGAGGGSGTGAAGAGGSSGTGGGSGRGRRRAGHRRAGAGTGPANHGAQPGEGGAIGAQASGCGCSSFDGSALSFARRRCWR